MSKKEEKKEPEELETFGKDLQDVVNKYLQAGASPFELIGTLQAMQFDILEHLKKEAGLNDGKDEEKPDY